MALPDQLDSEGWTPMHHAALLHDFRGFMTGLSPSASNPNSKFGRWTQEKKDYAFGSTTTSEIDVTRIVVSPVASDKPQTTSEGLSGVGSGTTSNLFGQSSNFGSSVGTGGTTRIFGSGFGSGNNDGNTFGLNDNNGNFNGGLRSGFGQGNNNGLGFGTNSAGFGTNDSNTFGFNNNSGASTSQEDLERPLKCNIEEVLPLLAHCNINSRTSYGETPLLLVTKSKYLKDDEKEKNIKALLQHGADPNISVHTMLLQE